MSMQAKYVRQDVIMIRSYDKHSASANYMKQMTLYRLGFLIYQG